VKLCDFPYSATALWLFICYIFGILNSVNLHDTECVRSFNKTVPYKKPSNHGICVNTLCAYVRETAVGGLA